MSKLVKNILVTGAGGQLGSEFNALQASFPGYNFLFATREQLAIESDESIANYFSDYNIDCCINCAAYTAVDKAETEKDKAIAVNATAVGNLAAICKQQQALFIHFSTDYVFNGKAEKPYTESDATDPVNFYGQTKLLGEQAAITTNSDAIIIRTSWVYGRFGKNFVKTMLRLMSERESIGVVADQYGCPTYASDLAAAVMQIIAEGNYSPGIYHYCNEGIISWHEFAVAIKELSGSNCNVNPIETAAYPTPAARPHYSALATTKILSELEVAPVHWKQSLQKCIALLNETN